MKELYKSCQVSVFCLALLLMAPSLLFSQKRTLTMHPDVIVDSFIHGFYTSLPASYGTGSKQYPLLIFLHGIGEIGPGSASTLPVLLNIGPQKQINLQINQGLNANFPDPVVVAGKSFEFIVVAPQLNTWPWNGFEQIAVNDMINYAIRNYRVDTSKMYLTGMSMGGGIAWEYPGFSRVFAKRLAGLIPVAGASSPSSQRAAEMAAVHLPVWATHNSSDPTVPTSYTIDYVQLLKDAGANPAPLMTIFNATGHGGWRQTYGDVDLPGCTNSAGQNIYQWMLQYRRSGDNVVLESGTTTSAPAVNAGTDLTITLPTSSVTLTGTGSQASGATITGYKWTEVSGPSTAVFGNAASAQTAVSGLVQGSYTFQLTVSNSAGLSASDQVKVTVNAAPAQVVFTVSAGPDVSIVLPMNSIQITGAATVKNAQVATCKWTQVSGPSTAAIASGGSIKPTMSQLVQGTYVFQVALKSTTGLTSSDQMTLTVKPLTTGTFQVYAGPDVTITLPTNSWKIAGVASVKGETPASCKWKQVSGPSTATISMDGSITPTVSNLIAGAYVFEVDIKSTTGLTSSDQMTLTVNTAAGAATASEISGIGAGLDQSSSIKLYPNPVLTDQELAIEGQGWQTGTVKFSIYDRTGRLVKQVTLENQASYFRQTISVSGLSRGAYILTATMEGEKPRTFKFIVQ
jgi:hypothetical protein